MARLIALPVVCIEDAQGSDTGFKSELAARRTTLPQDIFNLGAYLANAMRILAQELEL